ncbi:MAG: SGNH/GDSL hydrolase family protein [Lentisphaeria bacterium]|nr:SGNH/GDSL hydrolase family protein [Lentisphaeria bacterium]
MKFSIAGALLALVLAGCCSAPAGYPSYREMLVIGDALTACAPNPALGWPHDWGMAATARENDFAHRLHTALREASPELKLATDSIMYHDEMTGWIHLVPCSADLVVIQLGENYKGGIAPDEYAEAYGQMIDELREGNPKTVVCLGPWKNVQLEPVIAKAAAAHGAKFVSLREIYADPASHAASEGVFPKIGDMPGDRGMQKIAEAVLKSLGK